MSTQPIIEIENLSKVFKHTFEPAVNNVSLKVESNSIFGLLGPNGAGKTTIISILCGVMKPSTGDVTLDGLKISENIDQIKQIIGVVPQDIALYPTLTARENLEYFGAMYGLSIRARKDKITYWLEKLGLAEAADRRVETFSGGMKRRVNLIASILHEPKILFLDEPTVGVDVQSRNVIIEHLKELNKDGTTIIYTSHHLEEAEKFCEKIAIIDYGVILTQGTPKQLIDESEGAKDLQDVFLNLTKRKLRD